MLSSRLRRKEHKLGVKDLPRNVGKLILSFIIILVDYGDGVVFITKYANFEIIIYFSRSLTCFIWIFRVALIK